KGQRRLGRRLRPLEGKQKLTHGRAIDQRSDDGLKLSFGQDPLEPGPSRHSGETVNELVRVKTSVRIGEHGWDRPERLKTQIDWVESRMVSKNEGAHIPA